MKTAIDYSRIRRLVLKAIASEPWLYDRLFLKGGNALTLIYRASQRTSLDFDFSLESHFSDQGEASVRLADALRLTFDRTEYLLFDFTFQELPPNPPDDWWGGYRAEFKLIHRTLAASLGNDLAAMQRQSLTTAAGADARRFRVEISKHEHVHPTEIRHVDDTPIQVYSPMLIAAEKLRAILQQHDAYPVIARGKKRSRARDFYDIWMICEYFSVRLEAHLDLVLLVFEAKHLSPGLLAHLDDVHDLHAASWADVEASTGASVEDFEFYYAFVKAAADRLHTLWVENAPG